MIKAGKIILFLIVFSAQYLSQEIIRVNHSNDILKEFNELRKSGGKDFWIGYSIHRDSNNNFFSGFSTMEKNYKGITLEELIKNGKNPNTAKWKHWDGKTLRIINPKNKDNQDIAILFRYKETSSDINDFEEIFVCSLSDFVEIGAIPVYWFGLIENNNSASFLIKCYNETNDLDTKSELINIAGQHSNNKTVFYFLKNIVENSKESELQKKAVIYVGMQRNNEALQLLTQVIRSDYKTSVKEHAIYALGNINSDKTVDILVSIAKNADNKSLCKKAVYSLSQIASSKTCNALKDIIENDSSIELKKAALFALKDNQQNNIEYFINIAKSHKNKEIRKHAIWILSDSNDSRALDALAEIARQ